MTIRERLAAAAKQELEIIKPLSANDRKDWKRLREELGVHQDAVCSFVECLTEIRDRRLYREDYGTFDAYVAAELSISRRHVDRLIHHSAVESALGPRGPKITEKESRQLVNVPPEKIPEVIEKATAKAESEGRKRTAADLKAVASEVKPGKPKAQKAAKAKAADVPQYEETEDQPSEPTPEHEAQQALAIEELTRQRDTAIQHIADWCVAIDVNGGGWDDWDEYYKDAMWRENALPEIRGLLVEAIEEARKRRAG